MRENIENIPSRRSEIIRYFRANAPALAGAYEGAIRLLDDKNFPGRVHFIAHTMRDVIDRLPFAIKAANKHARVTYENYLDEIIDLWPQIISIESIGKSPDPRKSVEISVELALKLDALLVAHRDRRKRPSSSELLFRHLMKNEPSRKDVNLGLVSEFNQIRQWFMDITHLRDDAEPVVSESELQEQFEGFERILHSFVGSFFIGIAELDEILRNTKDEEIDRAVAYFGSPQHARHFFSKLENPNWVRPLANRKAFKYPPTIEKLDDGSVRYPNWAASKYLVKMAPLVPAEVAQILSAIDTENPSVVYDILQACNSMPAQFAKAAVPTLIKSGKNSWDPLRYKAAGELCVRLAEGGEVQSAIKLLDGVFALRKDSPENKRNRVDSYWYFEGLKIAAPPLARIIGGELLRKLSRWLRSMIALDKHPNDRTGWDGSCHWRPAIEVHPENTKSESVGNMVGVVADAFEEAITSRKITLDTGISILRRYPYAVYRRIEIHLVRIVANTYPTFARSTVLNFELFEDVQMKHEYALLVGSSWAHLTPEEKAQWFGWIDAGPDMSDFDDSVRRNLEREPTEIDREQRISYWKFEKLHWIREHLHGERKAFYEGMLAKRGEPEFADMNVRILTRWGHESPLTVDQLSSMQFIEAVEAVTSWNKPDHIGFGPDMEGLADTFEQLIRRNPSELSADARFLVAKPPIFVRHYLSALREAIRENTVIAVEPVLDLCRWILQHPPEDSSSAADNEGVDLDWRWTRDTISQLLEEICRARRDEKPVYALRFRSQIWDLITALTKAPVSSGSIEDPNESPDPRLIDYHERGINSGRGKALEAAFEYARWIGAHSTKSETALPGGFNVVPEFRQYIETQLTPEVRTVEAMSIIGVNMGLLYRLDKDWLVSKAGQLFDLAFDQNPAEAKAGWAAWNAFVTWTSPHPEFYRLFKAQYVFAVEQAALVQIDEDDREKPMQRLGKHIMLYYGKGVIGFETNDRIVKRFLGSANSRIRRRAIAFVGDSLATDKDVVPSEVIERFVTMWEVYWQGSGQADASESEDSDLFGTWFASGKFSPQWSIDRLEEVIRTNPKPEPNHGVVERLAEICTVDIEKAVSILGIFVENDIEGWRVQMWLESAKTILKQAISGIGPARAQAEKLISILGRRGYLEFGELLKS